VCWSPGSAGEFGNTLTNGEIDPLYEGGIDAAAQAKGFQASGIFCGQSPNHPLFHLDQAKAPLLFDDLGIGKVCQESPEGFAIGFRCQPLAEVGGECVEIVFQAVRAKNGNAAGFQPAFQLMYDRISHLLGPRANMENWNELVFGFAGDPDPQILLGLLEIGPKFIELDMSQFEVGKEALVELFTLQAAALRDNQVRRVISRMPKTSSIAEISTPTTSKCKTLATVVDRVFKRYKTV